jgi:Zn-finger nucleic acid-binding protein
MNCSNCNVPMLISQRQEVESDHCTQCHSVWLDRGELDKTANKSMTGEMKWHDYFRDDTFTC